MTTGKQQMKSDSARCPEDARGPQLQQKPQRSLPPQQQQQQPPGVAATLQAMVVCALFLAVGPVLIIVNKVSYAVFTHRPNQRTPNTQVFCMALVLLISESAVAQF